MGNKFKDIDLKNRTYFFDNMIIIKSLDLNKSKIRSHTKKSYKNILIYYIGYVMVKELRYVKFNSVNPLYLFVNKINGYIEESNGNKYLQFLLMEVKRH